MAFSSQQKGPSTSLSEINVTPLVDVMLVLLIVFMISAPLMQSGVALELPEGDQDMAAQEDQLVVSLDAQGKHYFNDQYLQADVLLEKVQQAVMASENKTVYLRGDANLPYGSVMGLLNRLKEAGIEEVSLVTDPTKAP